MMRELPVPILLAGGLPEGMTRPPMLRLVATPEPMSVRFPQEAPKAPPPPTRFLTPKPLLVRASGAFRISAPSRAPEPAKPKPVPAPAAAEVWNVTVPVLRDVRKERLRDRPAPLTVVGPIVVAGGTYGGVKTVRYDGDRRQWECRTAEGATGWYSARELAKAHFVGYPPR